MLELKLEQVTEKHQLYKNTDLKINPGVTVLIGPNGSGKSYCLCQLKENFKDALLIDIVQETANTSHQFPEGLDIGRWMCASEGQRVYDHLERLSTNVGKYVRYCKEEKIDPIILIDGADSGVSPDLIQIIRNFFNIVLEDCEKSKMTCYIICTANNFELVYDFNCIWMPTLENMTFDILNAGSYRDFRRLYLKPKNE